MNMYNNTLNIVKKFLERTDKALVARVLDDVCENKAFFALDGDDRIYYLYAKPDEESEESKEWNFWRSNIREYNYLYVYDMLFLWAEQWEDDEELRIRLNTFQNKYSQIIEKEIDNFLNSNNSVPESVLIEMEFLISAFHWKYKNEVPHFAEEQKNRFLSKSLLYERYVSLLTKSNSANNNEELIKRIIFCINIDNIYGGTECLNSLVNSLYGKRDAVSFDTMLKNISVDSSEADTLRKFVKDCGGDIPGDIIKFTLYSKISPNEQTDTDETNQQDETAKTALERAIDDFDILRTNRNHLECIDQLRLASYIRDTIVNDLEIDTLCSNDTEISSIRKGILNDIKDFQLNIINDIKLGVPVAKAKHDIIIKDFSQAKTALCELVRKEKDSYGLLDKDIHALLLNNDMFPSHLERLSTVEVNCSNEHYSVLIMGEYQTGKTTTLNALCNGMQIGAIGNGITTSAVPVSVTYSKDESVYVQWKDKKTLQDFLIHLIPHFPDFNYDTFDLEDNSSRVYWLKQLDNIRKEEDFFIRKGESQIKFLALCAAILKFYDSNELKNIRNSSLSLSHISSLSKFPEELSTKWCNGGIDKFSIGECAFVFIKKIACTCNSDLLDKLNCEIIDCPGLFSSAYDTEVTTSFMTEVDAILYILPYEKEVGKQVCDSLYYIKNNFPDIHRKLFLANNTSLIKETNFYEANLRKSKQLFGKDTNLALYDATLAYLGRIKLAYDNLLLDNTTISHFIEKSSQIRDAKKKKKSVISKLGNGINTSRSVTYFDSFEDAWYYRIRPYIDDILDDDLRPQNIIDKSGLSELANELVLFIENNRAYSTIVSNGINRLYDGISGLRMFLTTSYVEPYILGKEATIDRWEQRLNRCDKFNGIIEPIIDNYFFKAPQNNKSLSDKLGKNVYNKLFTKEILDGMIDKICYTLFANKFTLFKLRKKEQELKAFVTPLIEKDITDVLSSRIKYWNDIMKSGQDEDFKNIFEPSMRDLSSRVKEKWIYIYSGGIDNGSKDDTFINALQLYFTIPTETKDFYMASLSNDSDVTVKSDDLTKVILLQISVTIGKIAMFISSYICYLASASAAGGAVAISNPFGWLFGAIGLVAGAAILYFKGEDWILKQFNKRIKPQILSQFEEKNIYSSFENAVSSEIDRLLKDFSSNLYADRKKMEIDRDVASSKPKAEVEVNCFKAIESISTLNKTTKTYNTFITEYIDE